MLPPWRQHEGIMWSHNSSPDEAPHINEICTIMKTSFMTPQTLKYMLKLWQSCVLLDENYRMKKRRMYFHTSRSASLWWQKACYHFLVCWVVLCTPRIFSCSFLVQFKRCCWEATKSMSILTAAGACGTLWVFFFLSCLFCSHPEANVAWQEDAMNVNSAMCSGNDSCTSDIDEKNAKPGLKI